MDILSWLFKILGFVPYLYALYLVIFADTTCHRPHEYDWKYDPNNPYSKNPEAKVQIGAMILVVYGIAFFWLLANFR